MATHSRSFAWRIPMDRGVWWAAVHEVTELDTTEQLRTQHRHTDDTILMAESEKELKSLVEGERGEGKNSLKTQHSHLVSSLHGKCVSVSHLVVS